MSSFESFMCGIGTKHPPKSFFKNENGMGFWLMMCFNTDFSYYSDGKLCYGKKFDCLLNSPWSPLIHGPAPDMAMGFENDWIYFRGDGISEFVNELEIPINKAFFVGQSNCLTPYISSIAEETKTPLDYSEYYISQQIYAMLVNVARQRKIADYIKTKSYESIQIVRHIMMEECNKKQSLKSLANNAGYSVSRFCELYKKFYGISPIEDLVNMRINISKELLLTTDMPVGEIAEMCGFESIHYFSSMFKNKTGSSPLAFRRSINCIETGEINKKL